MRWLVARRVVQLAVLLLLVAPLLASGWPLFGGGVGGEDALATPATLPFYGSLSSSELAGFIVSDPFATLEVIAATKTVEPAWLLAGLVPLAGYALIGGRFFCGWVCPVNLVLELVEWVAGALPALLKLPKLPKLPAQRRERLFSRKVKLGVAAALLLISLLTGKLIFETLSPLGFLTKLLLFGSLAGVFVFAAIVLMELFVARRIWCRSLCPVGALYQLVGRFGLLKVHINRATCSGCGQCLKVCIADPLILEPCVHGQQSRVRSADCLRCGNCVDACPSKALRLHLKG